jgi:hypothetical protein
VKNLSRNENLRAHNNDKRQITIPPVKFELSIPASERFQLHNVDHVTNGIGTGKRILDIILQIKYCVSDTGRRG